MIRQLTFQEVAKKLAEEGTFAGYVRNNHYVKWFKTEICGVKSKDGDIFFYAGSSWWGNCGIEVPDEYEPYPDDVCPPLNCGDVIVSKEYRTNVLITMTNKEQKINKGCCLLPRYTYTSEWLTNNELFENYTMPDGSPIGRIKTQ